MIKVFAKSEDDFAKYCKMFPADMIKCIRYFTGDIGKGNRIGAVLFLNNWYINPSYANLLVRPKGKVDGSVLKRILIDQINPAIRDSVFGIIENAMQLKEGQE